MLAERKKSSPAFRRRCLLAAASVCCAVGSIPAAGQTAFGSGTEVVIPLAANVSIYHAEVFVRNPNAGAITLNVRYYQSINGTPPAGLRSCASVTLQGNQSSSFDLGAQCGLTGVDDDFGMLVLEDASPEKTNYFLAYSRTQTPDGIGFSVEGFPTSNFSGAPADVLGLRALSTAPNYRSNCFVASLADPVNWQLDLVQSGTETVLGSTSGSLGPYQTTRILDVFSSLGLAGDFTDVRATFSTPDNPEPSFVGFCTLETSSNGSADFRVAKTASLPPAPPATITTQTWGGPMITLNANQATYIFMGPTTTVTLAGTANVSAYGSGSFARNSFGAVTISIGVCYQDQNGPGPITVMGTPTTSTVTTTEVAFGAAGSTSLSAGTYNVGFCALNNNNAAINKNGNTSGFVFITQ